MMASYRLFGMISADVRFQGDAALSNSTEAPSWLPKQQPDAFLDAEFKIREKQAAIDAAKRAEYKPISSRTRNTPVGGNSETSRVDGSSPRSSEGHHASGQSFELGRRRLALSDEDDEDDDDDFDDVPSPPLLQATPPAHDRMRFSRMTEFLERT
jgi:hypothetical protein